MRMALASVALVAVSPATAQGLIVSPSVLAATPGPSSNAFPILGVASITSQRYLGIQDDMQGRVAVIRGVAFRPNEGAPTSPVSFNLEMSISTAAFNAASASTTFDLNHGPDKRNVIPPTLPISF